MPSKPSPTSSKEAVKNVFKLIKEHELQFVDFRFCDTQGVWHHIAMPVGELEEETFEKGLNFDGSSIEGWCPIHRSDMFYVPDADSAHIDPFYNHPTLVLVCDIVDAATNKPYSRCPRGIARRAEAFLKKSGVADAAFMGPELEFFVFDGVQYSTGINESFYRIETQNGSWSTGDTGACGTGHVAGSKGGYFKMPPVDRMHDLRAEILLHAAQVGLQSLMHHSEVGTASQCEVGIGAATALRKADEVMLLKHVIRQTADVFGYSATFMPKPLNGDNGSGMHVHQSLWKNGKNIFAGKGYEGLSKEALYYIGGIIKHGAALNALTNPVTNSYKRLIPGFEAPVILTYAARNRSAAIRIPASNTEKAKRIETRFPDPAANPYLAFSAMLLAGLDGIKNKIDPGKAQEDNLYELPPKQLGQLPQVCHSLRTALDALEKDHAFLTQGGVFDDDMLGAYIALKMEDIYRLEHTPHPVEFEMYYSR